MHVEIPGSVREQFVECNAFKHGSTRPLGRSVRLHRCQGVLDLLGEGFVVLLLLVGVAVLLVAEFVAMVICSFTFGWVRMVFIILIFAGARMNVGEVVLVWFRQTP
jgi:hypothetical protein